MPTPAEIVAACTWLEAQPDAIEVRETPGFWVDGLDAAAHDLQADNDYCWEHGQQAVERHLAAGQEDAGLHSMDHGETDGPRFCAVESCGKQLAAGAPTDYGIDNTLGLTEDDPMDAPTGAYDLMRASWSMSNDDERYRLWMWHVDVLRALARVA